MNQTRYSFSMIWCMEISKIYQEGTSVRALCNKAFEIASNSKHDRYQCRLTSMVYKFFDKKAGDTSTHTEQELFLRINN